MLMRKLNVTSQDHTHTVLLLTRLTLTMRLLTTSYYGTLSRVDAGCDRC